MSAPHVSFPDNTDLLGAVLLPEGSDATCAHEPVRTDLLNRLR